MARSKKEGEGEEEEGKLPEKPGPASNRGKLSKEEQERKRRQRETEKENRENQRNKRTKTVVWTCIYGCQTNNTRIIGEHRIINDDICDNCGKVYHEPCTVLKR